MIYTDFPDMYVLKSYASAMNARAKQTNSKGRLTATVLRAVILESGGKCGWCGINLLNEEFEIDHIHALTRGGMNAHDNLVMSCVSCNRRKGDKTALRFALEMVAANETKTRLVQRLINEHDVDAAHQPPLF